MSAAPIDPTLHDDRAPHGAPDPDGDTGRSGPEDSLERDSTPAPVVVRRNAGFAALVGAAASAISIAYLWRATESGAVLDWALCAVLAAIAVLYLGALLDARTPLLVADELGVRIRFGHQWRGLPWEAVAAAAIRPRRGILRDGRLRFAPHSLARALDGLDARGRRAASTNQKRYGAALAVPLGLGTRVSAREQDLADRLGVLSGGQLEVLLDEPETDREIDRDTARETGPETGRGTEPAAEPAAAPSTDAVTQPGALAGALDEEGRDPEPDDGPGPVEEPGDGLRAEHPRRGGGGVWALVSRLAGRRASRDADRADETADETADENWESAGQGGPTDDAPIEDVAASSDPGTPSGRGRASTATRWAVPLRQGRRGLRADVAPGVPEVPGAPHAPEAPAAVLGNAALLPQQRERADDLPEDGELRWNGDLALEDTVQVVDPLEAVGTRATGDTHDLLGTNSPAATADDRVRPISTLGDPVEPLVVDDFVTEPAYDPVIGPELAAARHRVGLSVDELSDRTRIRPHVIEAIEVDDFAPCGGDFYARGHLRTLARVLGRDPEPLLRQFDERYATAPINARRVFEAELATGMTGSVRGSRGGPNWSLLVGVVLVLVLVWGVVRLFATQPPETLQPPVPVSDSAAGQTHHVSGFSTAADPVTVALTGGQTTTRVVVRDRSGEVVWAGWLAPGRHRTVRATAPVHVQASNAGAVEVSVAGSRPQPLGSAGQPGRRTFHRPAGH